MTYLEKSWIQAFEVKCFTFFNVHLITKYLIPDFTSLYSFFCLAKGQPLPVNPQRTGVFYKREGRGGGLIMQKEIQDQCPFFSDSDLVSTLSTDICTKTG